MPLDAASEPRIKLTKLDAAKRQLNTAIRLWFDDGDQVAVHTLVAAAYDILHTLARRKGARNLLFDTTIIKDEYRKKWVTRLKLEASFFKHADRDPNGEIEFVFIFNEIFMLNCASALEQMKEPPSLEVSAFRSWTRIHRATLFKEESKSGIPIKALEAISEVKKNKFFETFNDIWRERTQNLSV